MLVALIDLGDAAQRAIFAHDEPRRTADGVDLARALGLGLRRNTVTLRGLVETLVGVSSPTPPEMLVVGVHSGRRCKPRPSSTTLTKLVRALGNETPRNLR